MTGLREQFRATLTSHWPRCRDDGGPTDGLLDDLVADREAAERLIQSLRDELTVLRRAKTGAWLATVAGFRIGGQAYAPGDVEIFMHTAGQPYTKADEAAVRAGLAESAQPPAPAAAPAPRRRTRAPAGGGKAKPAAGHRTAQGGAK